jgi:hypothetical protein
MSVDTRLRQARPDDDSRWDAGLDLALEGVVRSARRRRTRHAAVAAGAVAATLAVGGLAVGLTNHDESRPAPAGPAPTTPTTSASVARTSPLDGEWRTGKLDRQDVVTALEDAGTDPSVAADFATDLPRGTFRIRMLISRGSLQAHASHGDSRSFTQFVSATGDTLTMTPGLAGYGHWSYVYNLDGDSLTLDLSDSTVPDFGGFTSRVQGVAMFCVAPFTRAS